MLERLFCKHDYRYFHQSKYLAMFIHIWYKEYHFVCKKCGKATKLDECIIDQYSKKFAKKVAKEKVMGADLSEYRDYKFILGSTHYHGKLAYYMKKEFGQYKQEKETPYYN
jgi:hypothetical protein